MTTFYIRIEGDAGVGKSALLARAAGEGFNESYVSHITSKDLLSDSRTILVKPLGDSDSEPVSLVIEAGEPTDPNQKFDMIIETFALNNLIADVVDLSLKSTIERRIEQNKKILIVGSKGDTDLATENNKTKTMLRQKAKLNNFPYFETSAKSGENVDLLLQYIATCLSEDKLISVDEFIKRAKPESDYQLKQSFQRFINKLKPGQTRYPTFAALAADIENINKMTEQLKPGKYKKLRNDYRDALIDFLNSRSDVLLNQWDDDNLVEVEGEALRYRITPNLKIIQPDKGKEKKSMRVSMDINQKLIHHKANIGFIKDLRATGRENSNPETAAYLLATPLILDKTIVTMIINEHLIPTMNDAKRLRYTLAHRSKAEKKALKDRLIEYTVDQINASKTERTQAYEALCNDKDNPNSTIPLIYFLRLSNTGRVGDKTGSYETWLSKINKSISDAKKEEMRSGRGNGKQSIEQSEQEKADKIERSFLTFINKLKPGETGYQSIAQLADDVENINKMTAQLKPDKYKKMRAKYRDALVDFLNWRADFLLGEWNDKSLIEREREELLKKIIIGLEIINATESEKTTQEKKSMQVAMNIEDTLLLHYLNMSPMKILESSAEANPQLAISVLARSPKLDNDRLSRIITKHLIPPMTVTNNLRAPFDKKDKERLNERLIHYTKIQIHESTSNKTDAYKALFKDKENEESNIPLIHMLRLSDSGKAGEMTDSYVNWLSEINASVSKPLASVVSSLVKNGVFGVNDEILEKERIKRLLPFGEDREAIEHKVFSIEDNPKKSTSPKKK